MRKWLKKHRETAFASGISLLLIVCGWVLAWVKLRGIKEPLVLHYSTYTGINQIGTLREVRDIAITGLVIWALDTILASALDDREPFLGRLLAFGALAAGVLLFFAFLAIISLNS
jgi:hypothetical protein